MKSRGGDITREPIKKFFKCVDIPSREGTLILKKQKSMDIKIHGKQKDK